MAKISKRQQRLQKVKATIIDGATRQSFETDDLEGMFEQQNKMFWKEYESWISNCFKEFPEYWHYMPFEFKQELTINNEEYTVYFFSSKSFGNIEERMGTKLAGVLQITSESRPETCLCPVPYHNNCCSDWSDKEYDLTEPSKVITSIILNHYQRIQYPEWGTVLPYLFYDELKNAYMQNVGNPQSSNVYRVLD